MYIILFVGMVFYICYLHRENDKLRDENTRLRGIEANKKIQLNG